jgi:hypothetical protein
LRPSPIWQSRNDLLAHWLGDPTNEMRRSWMRQRAGDTPLVLETSVADEVSFLVLGDTGEGDASQYYVVPPLLSQAKGTDFLFICSDVIYPAGGVQDYGLKFFQPYRDYPGPIYAVPGNHDWYDDLRAFMLYFCGDSTPPPSPPAAFPSAAWLRNLLWRRLSAHKPADLEAMAAMRAASGRRARQPGPYFALDAGPLRLVGIDTGVTGSIDREQGVWLLETSRSCPKPKLLLTGKPIYVNAEYHPGDIEGGGTVDDIVRRPEHNYIGVIGGDIHNYQRYPVQLGDGRVIQYIVSGAGGAFTHATHAIPNVDRLRDRGVTERDFRCYPLRGDSLSRYSQLCSRKLGPFGRRLFIPPDEASTIMASLIGIEPVRPSARGIRVGAGAWRTAALLVRLPHRGRGPLHFPFSEFFDWNDPPLFKSFLRVDATPTEVTIRCFGVTGCRDHDHDPPVEDAVRGWLEPDGVWRWTVLK